MIFTDMIFNFINFTYLNVSSLKKRQIRRLQTYTILTYRSREIKTVAYSDVNNAFCDMGIRYGAIWTHFFPKKGQMCGKLNNATSPIRTQRSEMQSTSNSEWIMDLFVFFLGLLYAIALCVELCALKRYQINTST